jgi:hypothetical protein
MLHPALFVAFTENKGRGVFTRESLVAEMEVEVSPVIVLSDVERQWAEKTLLHDYLFAWGENETEAAVALGLASIYNHASPSNCEYILDYYAQSITIVTMVPIEAGMELTINYSARWNEQKPVWFSTAQ